MAEHEDLRGMQGQRGIRSVEAMAGGVHGTIEHGAYPAQYSKAL